MRTCTFVCVRACELDIVNHCSMSRSCIEATYTFTSSRSEMLNTCVCVYMCRSPYIRLDPD